MNLVWSLSRPQLLPCLELSDPGARTHALPPSHTHKNTCGQSICDLYSPGLTPRRGGSPRRACAPYPRLDEFHLPPSPQPSQFLPGHNRKRGKALFLGQRLAVPAGSPGRRKPRREGSLPTLGPRRASSAGPCSQRADHPVKLRSFITQQRMEPP